LHFIKRYFIIHPSQQNTGSKKMTLTEALAKIEQHKEQFKQPKQDYQPQPKQTRNQARAQYNFMRGMP
jgi:hypothetical protein